MPESLRKLWRHVNPGMWCQLLREVSPQNDWQLSGTTIKGRCPYHNDNDPSFVLDFAKGYGRCFGACGKYVDNIIKLFAHLLKVSENEAFLWLDERIDLSSVIGKENADQFGAYSQVQATKKAAAMAFTQVLQEYIREKPEYLSYLEPGFLYLTKGRNLSVDVLGSLPVAVFPKPEHAKKYMPEELHSAYDAYFQKYASSNYWGAVIFHYNDSPGTISRFKVRLISGSVRKVMDVIRSKESAPADLYKNLFQHDFRVMDDPYVAGTGLFGLHHYARSIGSTESCVYVTEGEFDALSVMAGQLQTGRHDIVMLASGGKGNTNVGNLREFGLRIVYLVQDSPAKNGDSVAAAFLRDKNNFTRDSSNIRLQFKLFNWPVELPGGDLDEAVQLSGYETVSTYLENGDNFLNALPWVERKCNEDIERVRASYDAKIAQTESDAEGKMRSIERNKPEGWETKLEDVKTSLETARKNNSDDYMREAVDIVRQWGQCLSDPSDLKVYLQACSQKLGRDVTELEPTGAGVYRPNTTEGAMEIVKRTLPNYLDMAFYERKEGKTIYHMWSKTRFEEVVVPTNDMSFSMMFAQHIGMTLVEWLRTHLGSGSVIEPKSDKCDPTGMDAEKKRSENAKFIMRQVLESMSYKCRSLDELKPIGQGIHYNDLSDEAKRMNYVYVVNGPKLFRGTYGKGTGLPVEWEHINSNVDCGMLFKLDKSQTWSFINDVDDLYAATRIDLHTLYENVKKVIGCWRFKNNDIMQRYLPAYLMAIPVMTAMGFVTMAFLQGPTSSGKTAFLQGLLGGLHNNNPVKPLVECAKYTMNASLAWLQREANRTALLMCFDESENDQKTTHGSQVKEIQTALYGVPTGGGVIDRASQDGSANTVGYVMFMPVIMAGIKMYSDDVFMSRVFVIMTAKDPKMKACETAISEKFTDEEYALMRQQVTLAMLPYMPQLVKRANELKRTFDAAIKEVGGNTRFVRLVLPGLAVLSMACPEEDVMGMFKDLVAINRDRLEAINNTDETNDVINAALNIPGIKATKADGIVDYVQARTLIMNGDIKTLNYADSGVYCIPEKKWIVLVWQFIKHNIFRHTYEYSRMRENAMREEALQSKYIVADITDAEHKYIVDYLNIKGIHAKTEYSVISLGVLMPEEDQEALALSFSRSLKSGKEKSSSTWDGTGNDVPIEAYEDEDGGYSF